MAIQPHFTTDARDVKRRLLSASDLQYIRFLKF